jgi:hypothetical protein
MFAAIIGGILAAQTTPIDSGLRLHLEEVVRQRAASYLIVKGTSPSRVERLMGASTLLTSNSHGPLGGPTYTSYSYFFSGVIVNFGPDGRVSSVSRGEFPR